MTEPPTPAKHRPYAARETSRQHGKIDVEIECPFCSRTVVVALWAWAGAGVRKCPCGARHAYLSGKTEPPREKK